MSKAEEAAGIRLAEIAESWEGKELFWDHHDDWWKKEKIEEAMSIVAAHDAERDPCRWTYEPDSDFWTSSCGEDWTFIDGGPAENDCKFCHGCGKPIEVAPAPGGGEG